MVEKFVGLNYNEVNGTAFYTSPDIEKLGFIRHFFSTRIGGISKNPYYSLNLGIYTDDLKENVESNFSRIFDAAGMNLDKMTYLMQRHGTDFYIIDGENCKDIAGKDGDALITSAKGISIGIFTADCVPIIIVDTVKRITAAVHAGWKGTHMNVAGEVLKAMKDKMGTSPGEVIAVLGPSIGPCCFEVGRDVAEKFEFAEYRNGRWFVDLWAENMKHMEDFGINRKNIISGNMCTVCNRDKFFSYRREGGTTGRMGTFIEIV